MKLEQGSLQGEKVVVATEGGIREGVFMPLLMYRRAIRKCKNLIVLLICLAFCFFIVLFVSVD